MLKKSAKKGKQKHKKRLKNGKTNASKTPKTYQEIRHLFCKDPVAGAPKGVRHGIKTCPTSSTKVLRLGQKTSKQTTNKSQKCSKSRQQRRQENLQKNVCCL